VNRQIGRLAVFFTLLIAILVGFTSYWSVWRADALQDEPLNRRPLLEQQQTPRGFIVASDGTKIAINERIGSGEKATYERQYPEGPLFSHTAGYAFIQRGAAGLEQFYGDVLSGTGGDLRSFIDEIAGGPEQGDDIRTTLDPEVQRVALEALGERKGAIVAIDPRDGAILAMVSNPDFDPNAVKEQFGDLNSDEDSPLLNRATQGRYAPGSTMKVVTAAAALDTEEYTPDSQIDGRNNKPISGVPLSNFGGQDFGTVSLTDALTNSVNTVFGEIGEKLGTDTMYEYMRRFGFNQKPPLDYPSSQIEPSGVFVDGKLADEDDNVDIGRVAIGQERLQVTPLQMAMVAAAVANGGRLMRPHFLDRVIGPDGRVKDTFNRQEQSRVMSEKAASDLTGMMESVVESGSGTAAQLQGLQVAGKTGTAETGEGDNAWFIAFAPSDEPEVAVAVVVEGEQQSQTGGEVAAPLAAQVMRAVLGDG
jgi:peptidoglycan glycosyltransferase